MVLPTSPAYCALTFDERLTAVGEALNGVTRPFPSLRPSGMACSQYAADVAQVYASLLAWVQAMFDELRRWATTPQLLKLVDQASQSAMDTLRRERDQALKIAQC